VQRRLCAPIERLLGLGSHKVIRLQTGHLATVRTFEVALVLKTRNVSGTQAFVSVSLDEQ
jgi:hypothetical protein